MGKNQDIKVQELIDKSEIERVVKLYCRAIDRLDKELLVSIYHPEAIDEHGAFTGNAHEFAEYIIPNLRDSIIDGMHTVTHVLIEVDGDFAASEAYYFAYQRCHGGLEKIRSFFGDRYANKQFIDAAIDNPQDYICGGRYLDIFEKRDDAWKIRYRKITNEWGIVQPASQIVDEGYIANFNLPGARDRSDPVYRIFSPGTQSLAEHLKTYVAQFNT